MKKTQSGMKGILEPTKRVLMGKKIGKRSLGILREKMFSKEETY